MDHRLLRHLTEFAGPCVIVTHDPFEALTRADTIAVIEDFGAYVVMWRPRQQFVLTWQSLRLRFARHCVDGRRFSAGELTGSTRIRPSRNPGAHLRFGAVGRSQRIQVPMRLGPIPGVETRMSRAAQD